MVRVIENKPVNTVNCEHCEHCGALLEFENSDIFYGEYGLPFIECPQCHKMTSPGDWYPGLSLTPDNLEFPKHFVHLLYDGEIPEETVKKYVKEGVEWFQQYPDEDFCVISGKLFTIVYKSALNKDVYNVVVTGNCYETNIIRED